MAQLKEIIREARRAEPRWTQRKLAIEAGVNVDTIHRAEAGDNLELVTIRKIAKALTEKTGRDVLGQAMIGGDEDAAPAAKGLTHVADDDLGAERPITIREAFAATMTEELRSHLAEQDVQDLLTTYLGLPAVQRREARRMLHAMASGAHGKSAKKAHG